MNQTAKLPNYQPPPRTTEMVFGSNLVWRYPQERQQYSVCSGLELPPGILLAHPPGKRLEVIRSCFYQPVCYNNAPVLSTFKKAGVPALPLIKEQWEAFTSSDTGNFRYSIYPIIYSITVSSIIAIFLTIIVFTNHTQNPSWLLRGSSLLASINLTVLFVRSIVFLNAQHSTGYSSGEKLLDDLQSDQVFNVIDFVFVLLVQFAQVQVIIRLFSRVKEKRVSFILGGTLSLFAQAIWGVSTFSVFDQEDESDISILPAFIYLLRIALSVMYSALIVIYAVGKIQYIVHKSIILLSIMTFLVINLQVAFFITDISNIWVSELSEIFNTTIYVSATVIPWEWINRVHALERADQREGVLGRPVYEDEYKDIMRYEIVDTADPQDRTMSPPDVGNDHDYTRNTASPKKRTPSTVHGIGKKIKNTMTNTTNALLYFTDQVIAHGLAVPRSVSVNSSERNKEARQKRQSKKEVFVYSRKEVVCDSDNETGSITESTSATFDDSGVGSSRDHQDV